MFGRLGFWIAHFNVVAVCAVLLGALAVQFVEHEMPCPLCMLQRMAMLLCALGPTYVLLKTRGGDVEPTDFAAGYGISVVAAVAGAGIAGRQVLLHIMPGDKGYGNPVFGLHLYTWSFIVFVTVLVVAGLNLIFVRELRPRGIQFGWPTTLLIWLLGAVIVVNAVAVFFEEGLHWTLPPNPDRYQLFEDIGRSGGPK